jgi:hypothetical protein
MSLRSVDLNSRWTGSLSRSAVPQVRDRGTFDFGSSEERGITNVRDPDFPDATLRNFSPSQRRRVFTRSIPICGQFLIRVKMRSGRETCINVTRTRLGP